MKKVIVFFEFLKIIFLSMLFIKAHGGRTMGWFTLGKKRSKFGKFLDKNDITQKDVVKKSSVSRGTISRLCQTEQ